MSQHPQCMTAMLYNYAMHSTLSSNAKSPEPSLPINEAQCLNNTSLEQALIDSEQVDTFGPMGVMIYSCLDLIDHICI